MRKKNRNRSAEGKFSSTGKKNATIRNTKKKKKTSSRVEQNISHNVKRNLENFDEKHVRQLETNTKSQHFKKISLKIKELQKNQTRIIVSSLGKIY